MAKDDFQQECNIRWDETISTFGSGPQFSCKWDKLDEIKEVLKLFMGPKRNHAHLPDGGGLDFLSVEVAPEKHCLEFSIGEKSSRIVKPETLWMEKIESVGNSFLLLDLGTLEPLVGNEFNKLESVSTFGHGRQELLELSRGQYVDRSLWDQGYLGHDENECEIPFPQSAKLVMRFFSGKILFVSVGSDWNDDTATYDGRHSKLTSVEIRQMIEQNAQ